MKFLKKLEHNLFAAIAVIAVSLIGFLASCFLISGDYQDIPFGFLLSGGIVSTTYLLSYFLIKIDTRRGSTIFSMIAMAVRFVILIASMLLIVLMYYRWGIKLFNVFVFVGVYTLGIIVLCISYLVNKDGKEENA